MAGRDVIANKVVLDGTTADTSRVSKDGHGAVTFEPVSSTVTSLEGIPAASPIAEAKAISNCGFRLKPVVL
jgi:hypothetical protein